MTLDHAKQLARNNKATYGGVWRVVTAGGTLWIQLVDEHTKLPKMPDAKVEWTTDEDNHDGVTKR